MITLYDPRDGEVKQSVNLMPPQGKTPEKMRESDWDDVAKTIQVQSGWAYVHGEAKRGEIVVNKKLVPRPPVEKTFEELKQEAYAQIDVEYGRAIQMISSGYPLEERESWPIQTAEARALLADINAFTPWIDAASEIRGISRMDMAQRIAGLEEQYRHIHGKLSGTKQLLQSRIIDAKTMPELAGLVWRMPEF